MTPKLIDDWRRVAACRDAEPELFFPISATAAAASTVRRAKLICASCSVRPQCLSYALAHRQEQGIWGGLTDEERRSLRARMAGEGQRGRAARQPGELVRAARG